MICLSITFCYISIAHQLIFFVIMDTLKIRANVEYECRRGSNAAQAARYINDAYGANTTNQRTTWYRFARFCSGYFDLKNQPRGRNENFP